MEMMEEEENPPEKMELNVVQPVSYPTNLLRKNWAARKCYYCTGGQVFVDRVHTMEVRNDDVWLVSIPKTGSTWMQEMLWLIINNFHFAGAKRKYLETRAPYLDLHYFLYRNVATALKPVEDLKSPRLIKTHLPLPMLPYQLWQKKPKLIYVFRHPIDVMVSEFYHMRSIGLDLHHTVNTYVLESIRSQPLTPDLFDHVTEFYALRNKPWVYYTTYERMKSDLRGVVHDLCNFLDKPIKTRQMKTLLKHLSFEQMSKNPKTNHIWELKRVRKCMNVVGHDENFRFVRRGKAGGYKDELSKEVIAECKEWLRRGLARYRITLRDLLLLDPTEDDSDTDDNAANVSGTRGAV